eukprot:TRINITY_DN69875_c0_g1_i1.p1 TRINITY_DN69875_c0_g1~~TRINITY_DN69875_c0_g1_i1.p1  ORF type:complete len:440 (+),score=53.73 TRINITY_DN69875_c0_g1_i1:74-1393(+)
MLARQHDMVRVSAPPAAPPFGALGSVTCKGTSHICVDPPGAVRLLVVACVVCCAKALTTHREAHAYVDLHETSLHVQVSGLTQEWPNVSSGGDFATSDDRDEYMNSWRQFDVLGAKAVQENESLADLRSAHLNGRRETISRHGGSSTGRSGVCARINLVSTAEGSPPTSITSEVVASTSPHYVFIAGGAYTGTTGLLGLISTSPEVSNLCSAGTICCEGSWLLKREGLVDQTIASEPQYPSDWGKAIDIFSQYWNLSKPVLVDKSPEYLGKFSRIWEDLGPTGAKVSFIYLVASPCYFLSSATLRHGQDMTALMADWKAIFAIIEREVDLLRAAGANVLVMKAENMIGDPYGAASKLLNFVPELRSLDPSHSGVGGAPYVKAGDARAQSTLEFAERSIGKRYIGDFTGEEGDSMNWLGYTEAWLESTAWVGEDVTLDGL